MSYIDMETDLDGLDDLDDLDDDPFSRVNTGFFNVQTIAVLSGRSGVSR